MNTRHFEPFYDPVDLSACVLASDGAGTLNQRFRADQSHFPLWLDLHQPLGELFLNTRATSRSFRYGHVGDNVLGMRWKLPDGRRVDLGGRVVKNVAGFDLLRFFAGSRGRFGRPETLILRLRPLAETETFWKLSGTWERLGEAATLIRSSAWAHVIDALDLRADLGSTSLHLAFGAPVGLQAKFVAQLETWARQSNCELEPEGDLPLVSARPSIRLQTTLNFVLPFAMDLRDRFGGKASAFLGQGIVHFDPDPERAEALLAYLPELQVSCSALGGHVEHDSLKADPASPQLAWERKFLAAIGSLP